MQTQTSRFPPLFQNPNFDAFTRDIDLFEANENEQQSACQASGGSYTRGSLTFSNGTCQQAKEPEVKPAPTCPKPPNPGPGKATLDRNIKDARIAAAGQNRATVYNLFAISALVTTSQNYKANSKYRGSAPFGNFNFGATLQARAFTLRQVLELSNAFQLLTTRRSDPPEDIADVTNGFNYAARGCERK